MAYNLVDTAGGLLRAQFWEEPIGERMAVADLVASGTSDAFGCDMATPELPDGAVLAQMSDPAS